jgi:two-component system cell cycle sensor histidine kinase/response regulator CckA
VEISFALDRELGRVRIDRGRMEQAIVNLAVNSRDAMPEGGRLEIRTSNIELRKERNHHLELVSSGRYVLLSVSDAGEGMDAETKGRIFEPFFTTKPPDQGTGLGLSTVFGFVSQSEGHILVESDLGRGTTFEIFLPRID